MFYQPRQSSRRFETGQPVFRHQWARRFLTLMMAASLVVIGFLNTAQAENCALDPTFGKGGIVITDFGGQETANAAALQPDGKIIAAGSSFFAGVALARYNPNGSLDNSFGNGGKVSFTNFPSIGVYAIALQSDGKIVVAGTVKNAITPTGDFVVLRFNPDGSLDDGTSSDSTPGDAFGAVGVGLAVTDFSGGQDIATDLAIQPGGKIVVVGTANVFTFDARFGAARYNTDGSLDDGSINDTTPSDSFGNGGKAVSDFAGITGGASSVVLQPSDGKIVIGGNVALQQPSRTDFAVSRFNPNGTPDPTFGDGGTRTTDFFGNDDGIVDIRLQSDGKIVAVGWTQMPTGAQFALARYNTNGDLDNTFGNGGRVVTDLPNLFIGDFPTSMAIQPADGKIVVAGFVGRVNNPEQMNEAFAVVRYNPNGTLDTSFDEDGMTFTDIRGAEDEANAVLIQPDGNIVAVGSTVTPPNANYNFALVRYLGDAADYAPTLDSVTLPLSKTVGGVTLTGTVKLCGTAPAGGVKVALTDTLDSAHAQSMVTIPAGETMATFLVTTKSTLNNEGGSVIAKLGTVTRTAPLVIQKIGLFYLALEPNPVVGPNPAKGAVVLNGRAPAGGITVTLSSKNPGVASPTVSTVFIPEGMQQKNFTIQTHDVPSQRSAIIMATANGTSKSRVLVVQ